MNRTDALRKLMKKQTQAIAARWQYRITGKLTHSASETEPWTAGLMTLTREHRSTGAVAWSQRNTTPTVPRSAAPPLPVQTNSPRAGPPLTASRTFSAGATRAPRAATARASASPTAKQSNSPTCTTPPRSNAATRVAPTARNPHPEPGRAVPGRKAP
jgi:hypothetical protein